MTEQDKLLRNKQIKNELQTLNYKKCILQDRAKMLNTELHSINQELESIELNKHRLVKESLQEG